MGHVVAVGRAIVHVGHRKALRAGVTRRQNDGGAVRKNALAEEDGFSAWQREFKPGDSVAGGCHVRAEPSQRGVVEVAAPFQARTGTVFPITIIQRQESSRARSTEHDGAGGVIVAGHAGAGGRKGCRAEIPRPAVERPGHWEVAR